MIKIEHKECEQLEDRNSKIHDGMLPLGLAYHMIKTNIFIKNIIYYLIEICFDKSKKTDNSRQVDANQDMSRQRNISQETTNKSRQVKAINTRQDK